MEVNSDHQEQLIQMAQLRLSQQVSADFIPRQQILATVQRLLLAFPEWRETISVEEAVARLSVIFGTFVGPESVLQSHDTHRPWLNDRRNQVRWRLWERYRTFLVQRRMPQASINSLDRITDRILDLAGNPAGEGAFDRRGMVVGDVQSGKTGNYTGLICKAADAGYKVIIVLAGMSNNLRSQTQLRLDEGFIGKISVPMGETADRIAGVGLIDPGAVVDWGTNRNERGDFNWRAMSQFGVHPGGHPLILVVKKNVSVLGGLLEWMRLTANVRASKRPLFTRMPLLVIDDEADNASVDTKFQTIREGNADPGHQPTVINSRIRQILAGFDQVTYVGYTATPFANIFIHPDAETGKEFQDLFPRNFIVNLPTPDNYVGATRIFGAPASNDDDGDVAADTGLPHLVRTVDDYAASTSRRETSGWMPPVHRKEHVPLTNDQEAVPGSMRKAIMSFVLVTAARAVRGQSHEHNSMLVHVTRYKAVQRHVVRQIQDALDTLRNDIRYGGAEGLAPLRALWLEDFEVVTRALAMADCPAMSWEEVETAVRATVGTILVKEINGSSSDILDYDLHRDRGLNVIAIGGDKLARGLTLEGLSVSYFLRGSTMYDTLMQMGRWFGYRPGYLDLCRLFTTQDHLDWYGHIAHASDELRREFDRMEAMKAEPVDFGLKVRSHSSLMVTSRAKMRYGTELQVSFAGDISETTVFSLDRNVLEANMKAVTELLARMPMDGAEEQVNPVQQRSGGRTHRWQGSYVWSHVPAGNILKFLDSYSTHEDAARANASVLAKYIQKQNQRGELSEWDVLLVSGDGTEHVTFGDIKVNAIIRQPKGGYGAPDGAPRVIDPGSKFVIRRLVNPRDEAVDLDGAAYDAAMVDTLAAPPKRRRKSDEPPKAPAGHFLREYRSAGKGLLLLYPLARCQDILVDGKTTEHRFLPVEINPVGMGISFPASKQAASVTYIVNSVYGAADDDDDDGDA